MIHSFGSKIPTEVRIAYRAKQVHGSRCVEVREFDQDCGEADGFWTQNPQIPVRVVTADCVPILAFWGNENRPQAVAALHAGWRGVLGQITQSFFAGLPSSLQGPRDWTFWLGPSIRPPCYEVDEALIQRFCEAHPGLERQKIEPFPRQLDLIAVLEFQLRSLGVEKIQTHPDCTFCTVDLAGQHQYRSYRRGDRNARQVSWIQIF